MWPWTFLVFVCLEMPLKVNVHRTGLFTISQILSASSGTAERIQ